MTTRTMVLGGALALGLASAADGTPMPAPIHTADSLVAKVQCRRAGDWLNMNTGRCEPIPNDTPTVEGRHPKDSNLFEPEFGYRPPPEVKKVWVPGRCYCEGACEGAGGQKRTQCTQGYWRQE
jgi:hypothetical protein